MKIPMADPARQYQSLLGEIDTAVSRLLLSGEYIGGGAVEAFECELASFLGLQEGRVVSCANGTDALELTYLAIGLQAGDEIIIPTHNYVAAAESALRLGLIPVWADIVGQRGEQCFNINVDLLGALLSPRVKAVVAVNLYGMPIDAVGLRSFCREHGLILIEDNAQGLGGLAWIDGKYIPMGTLGDISTTSFFPTKPLGAMGDGGAIITSNPEWAERARCLARHGQAEKYDYRMVGRNSRLDALQAEILRIKLRHLRRFVEMQQEIADLYTQALSDDGRLTLPLSGKHQPTYHQYTLLLDGTLNREDLRQSLIHSGIASGLYYPKPLHLYEVYAQQSIQRSTLRQSEAVGCQMLSLPIFPLMRQEEANAVINHLKKLLKLC